MKPLLQALRRLNSGFRSVIATVKRPVGMYLQAARSADAPISLCTMGPQKVCLLGGPLKSM